MFSQELSRTQIHVDSEDMCIAEQRYIENTLLLSVAAANQVEG